jgi:hypothetical protein
MISLIVHVKGKSTESVLKVISSHLIALVEHIS